MLHTASTRIEWFRQNHVDGFDGVSGTDFYHIVAAPKSYRYVEVVASDGRRLDTSKYTTYPEDGVVHVARLPDPSDYPVTVTVLYDDGSSAAQHDCPNCGHTHGRDQ